MTDCIFDTDYVLIEHYDYLIHHSPYYKDLLEKGLLPPGISGTEDLKTLPFTTKQDLRQSYPFGFLASPREDLIRYGESTGTTGNPTASFMTQGDWDMNLTYTVESYSRFAGKADTAVIAIPYELAFSAIDIDKAFSALGVTVVPVGALNKICPWDRVLQIILEIRPTILVCSATRAIRFAEMLAEQGLTYQDTGLQVIFYVGEAASGTKVKKMEQEWGVKTVTAYGSTETNTLSLPCSCNRQHLNEERYLFEVVDPVTAKPVPGGKKGELAVTSLCNEAMPLLRYRTGDYVSVLQSGCDCGRKTDILIHYGRIQDILHVGSKILSKVELEDIILSAEGMGFYYHYYFNPSGQMVIEIENTSIFPAVKTALIRKVQGELGISPSVVPVSKARFNNHIDSMLKPGLVNSMGGGMV